MYDGIRLCVFYLGRNFQIKYVIPKQLAPAGFYRCIRAPCVSVFHIIADTARYRFCAIALTLAKCSSQTSANLKEGGETFLRKLNSRSRPAAPALMRKGRRDI
jgi:hypothetical protein